MKTKTKIFLASLIAVFAIVWQEAERRLYNINPQIWVFFVYAMVLAGLFLIFCAFYEELVEMQYLENLAGKMENNKFLEFFNSKEEYLVDEEKNKIKRAIKKVLVSHVYEKIDFIKSTFVISTIIYSLFFIKYFWPSKFMGIMYLLIALDCFMNAIVSEKKKIYYSIFTLIDVYVAVMMFF